METEVLKQDWHKNTLQLFIEAMIYSLRLNYVDTPEIKPSYTSITFEK